MVPAGLEQLIFALPGAIRRCCALPTHRGYVGGSSFFQDEDQVLVKVHLQRKKRSPVHPLRVVVLCALGDPVWRAQSHTKFACQGHICCTFEDKACVVNRQATAHYPRDRALFTQDMCRTPQNTCTPGSVFMTIRARPPQATCHKNGRNRATRQHAVSIPPSRAQQIARTCSSVGTRAQAG